MHTTTHRAFRRWGSLMVVAMFGLCALAVAGRPAQVHADEGPEVQNALDAINLVNRRDDLALDDARKQGMWAQQALAAAVIARGDARSCDADGYRRAHDEYDGFARAYRGAVDDQALDLRIRDDRVAKAKDAIAAVPDAGQRDRLQKMLDAELARAKTDIDAAASAAGINYAASVVTIGEAERMMADCGQVKLTKIGGNAGQGQPLGFCVNPHRPGYWMLVDVPLHGEATVIASGYSDGTDDCLRGLQTWSNDMHCVRAFIQWDMPLVLVPQTSPAAETCFDWVATIDPMRPIFPGPNGGSFQPQTGGGSVYVGPDGRAPAYTPGQLPVTPQPATTTPGNPTPATPTNTTNGPNAAGTSTNGPVTVSATGRFTNGRGPCEGPATVTDTFTITVDGSRITITQSSTGDVAAGTVDSEGNFQAVNPGKQSYSGRIAGTTITGTHLYTANGCTRTYDATFTLSAPLRH